MRTTPVQTKLLENISPRFDLEVQVGMSNLDLLLKLPDEHLMEPQPSQRIVFCASCEPVEFTSNRHHLLAQFAEQIHSPNPLDKLRKVSINRTCTVIQPWFNRVDKIIRASAVILAWFWSTTELTNGNALKNFANFICLLSCERGAGCARLPRATHPSLPNCHVQWGCSPTTEIK